MSKEELLSELKDIRNMPFTGDARGDYFSIRHRLDKVIKKVEKTYGRQSVEGVREDSSKVFHLD